MKNIVLPILSILLLVVADSCTKSFKDVNTNPIAATPQQLSQDYLDISGFIIQMEQGIVPNRNNGNADLNQYQLMYNLCADNFSGQQGPSNDFGSNQNNNTYNLAGSSSWYGALFNNLYTTQMTPWAMTKSRATATAPYAVAIAQIIKVMAMQQVTDSYGPIPYTQFQTGALATAYDTQETVYNTFFTELDEAISLLKKYMQTFPGQAPLQNIDIIYKSDLSKWIKLANSLKLRVAMRIVYANPAKAQVEAEAAIQGGVITDNADNALITVDGSNNYNPLNETCYNYNDTRMGATMESYLRGYNDPRAALLFNKVAVPVGSTPDYHGIRTGINVNTGTYRPFSTFNITRSTPIQLMAAAEVYFLRAEGALRNWAMSGSAKDMYEKGVQASFSQPIGGGNSSAGDATAYLADGISKPAVYIDPVSSQYSSPALSTITIKWDAGASFETNLERIITQKWIALFPQGMEAWAEFRRTGYPKVFPVAVNNSAGLINTQIQIRRLPFPQSEYQLNNAAVLQGVSLLGGADNGGTKVWWDKKP